MSSKTTYLAKPDALQLTQRPGHMCRVINLEELVSEQASKLQTTADVVVCNQKAFNAKFGLLDGLTGPFNAAIAAVLRSNPDLKEAQGCAVKAFKAYIRALAPDYVPPVREKQITYKIPHVREGGLQLPQNMQAEVLRLTSDICSYEHKNNREFYEEAARNALDRLADNLLEEAAHGALTPIPANYAVMETAAASIDAELMGWLKPRKTNDIIVVHFELNKILNEIAWKACKGRESGMKYAFQAIYLIKENILNLWRGLLVHSGITYKGEKYIILTASPGQQRKDEAYFVKKSLVLKQAQRLLIPGGTKAAAEQMHNLGKKIFFSKYMQYIGLGLSTARPSSKTKLGAVRLRNLICVKEPKGFLEANKVINVVVNGDNLRVKRPETAELKPVNPGDGSVIFIKEHMPASAADICVQIRAQFGIKGCGAVVPLLKYLKENGYDTRVKNVDGDEVDVADPEVMGIITPDEWKTKDFFASWKEYVRLAEEAGVDEVYVAGDNQHPQKGFVKLSNQMVQSLWTIKQKELEALIEYDMAKCRQFETLEGAYDEFAALRKPWEEKSNHEKLVAVAPAFLNTFYMHKRCNDKKFKNFCRLMTGKVKVPGIYVFVQPDWTAFADIVFGGKPFETAGTLPAGQCSCNSPLIEEGDCVLERSPHIGDEHVESLVVKHKWLNTKNVCFVSYHDFTLWRLGGADCDGDHVYVVQWDPLQNVVHRQHGVTGNPLVWWDGLTGTKKEFPTKMIEYNQSMVKTLRDAYAFNLVGYYSSINRIFWQRKSEEDDEQYIIAALTSYAVDAVKTGTMLGKIQKKKIIKPNYIRYSQKITKEDGTRAVDPTDQRWEKEKLSMGFNSMDKLDEIVLQAHIDREFASSEIDDAKWFWGMLQNRDPRFNVGSIVGTVPPETAGDVLLESAVLPDEKAPKKTLGYLLSLLRDGKEIGLADYFRTLTYTQAATVNETTEEDNEVNAELKTVSRNDFIERTRARLVEFCQKNGAGKIDGMSDEDCLRYCANVLMRNQMVRMKNEIKKRKEETPDLFLIAHAIEKQIYLNKEGFYRDFSLQSLFDIFGDVYAEAYLINEKEGFVPENRFKWVSFDTKPEKEAVPVASTEEEASTNLPTRVKGKIAQPSMALPEPEWVSDFDYFDDGVVNIPDDI